MRSWQRWVHKVIDERIAQSWNHQFGWGQLTRNQVHELRTRVALIEEHLKITIKQIPAHYEVKDL